MGIIYVQVPAPTEMCRSSQSRAKARNWRITPEYSDKRASLLGEHLFDLLVTEDYLVDGVALSFEGFEVAFDVGG